MGNDTMVPVECAGIEVGEDGFPKDLRDISKMLGKQAGSAAGTQGMSFEAVTGGYEPVPGTTLFYRAPKLRQQRMMMQVGARTAAAQEAGDGEAVIDATIEIAQQVLFAYRTADNVYVKASADAIMDSFNMQELDALLNGKLNAGTDDPNAASPTGA